MRSILIHLKCENVIVLSTEKAFPNSFSHTCTRTLVSHHHRPPNNMAHVFVFNVEILYVKNTNRFIARANSLRKNGERKKNMSTSGMLVCNAHNNNSKHLIVSVVIQHLTQTSTKKSIHQRLESYDSLCLYWFNTYH